MFIDARTLPETSEIETGLCIVGAGPAGITLAREIASRGTDVCLLESGGFEHDEETQSLCRGKNIGFPYYDLDLVQVRRFGGAGNVWSGASRPLDAIDFAKRESLPYSGWPFDKSHLDPYYKRAHEVLELGPYRYDVAEWETAEARRLALGEGGVTTAIYRVSPTRFGAKYREEIERTSNIKAYLFANVIEIEVNPEGRVVSRVRAVTLQGQELAVKAKAFVLATGAIENARLLLASDGVQQRGLGNDRDLVGRFFMEHLSVPGAVLMTSSPDTSTGLYSGRESRGVWGVGYLTLSPEALSHEGVPNIRASVLDTTPNEAARKSSLGILSAGFLWNSLMSAEGTSSITRHLRNVIADVDGVLLYGYFRAFRPVDGLLTLVNHIEQRPNPDSRVTLTSERDRLGMPRAAVDWRFGSLERDALRQFNGLIAQAVGEAGLGRIRILDDEPETGWPRGVRGAWHQIGTTRMDSDPSRGVVDQDCRIHGLANLYIAGSSVFPTSGYTNPTLTIVALALRLADHMDGVLR
jgi:choline dehydrogenase-like flavoprotein